MVEEKFGQVIEMIFARKEELTNEIATHFIPLKEACDSNFGDHDMVEQVNKWKEITKKDIEEWKANVEMVSYNLVEADDTVVPKVEALIDHNAILKDAEAQSKKVALQFDSYFPTAIKRFCKWKDSEVPNLLDTIGEDIQAQNYQQNMQ